MEFIFFELKRSNLGWISGFVDELLLIWVEERIADPDGALHFNKWYNVWFGGTSCESSFSSSLVSSTKDLWRGAFFLLSDIIFLFVE